MCFSNLNVKIKEKDSVFLWLPTQCQSTCKFCAFWDKEFEELSLTSIKKKLLRLKNSRFNRINEIIIFGGAPFDYPYLDDIVLFANQQDISCCLVSHCLYKKDRLKKMSDLFRRIWVPFSAACETLFFERTGYDVYLRYLDNIRYLKQLGVDICLVYELREACVDELPDIFNTSVDLDVKLEILYNKCNFNRDEQNHIEYFKIYKNVQLVIIEEKYQPTSCLASSAFINKVKSTHMLL